MPRIRKRIFSDIHIGQSDVERIDLGQGKFLYHISDRFFINDRDREGNKIWKEIPPGEKVFLGTETLSFPPQLFYGEERITLTAYDLVFSKAFQTSLFQRQERVFCNHMSFRAEPGTLTGIMGPSGAGKTVLLNLLSGYAHARQAQGHIFINETYDMHKDRKLLGRTIGYVPQDDTLIPQLTVRDSLKYSCQLRYAGLDADITAHIIRDACEKSGFSGIQLDKLLPNRIGSPDDKTLSGGERKRVNIAHELIRNPLLLFLDEPTSGLSSVDSDNVIRSLKDLCTTTQITIILTIHQPSIEAFEQLDRLLVVNRGGNVAYFGAAPDAVSYLENHAGFARQPHQNSAEFILKALEYWTETLQSSESDNGNQSPEESIRQTYQSDRHHFPFQITDSVLARLQKHGLDEASINQLTALRQQTWFWREDCISALQEALEDDAGDHIPLIVKAIIESTSEQNPEPPIPHEKIQHIPHLSTSFFQQFWVLLKRNHAVARADKKNRLFQFIQPLVIACLMLMAFAWYAEDYYTENLFAKVGYDLMRRIDRNETVFLKYDVDKAREQAYDERRLIGEGAANRRAAVLFLLIASCIWFGIINSCKEIVDERTVLRREAKSTLRISSYLVAKVVSLGWICLKQTVLLMSVILLPNLLLSGKELLPQSWNVEQEYLVPLLRSSQLLPATTLFSAMTIVAILAITAVLASWLGLLISAVAPTQKTALTVVPLVIIPQLLFGGLIRPIKDIERPERFMLTEQSLQRLEQELPKELTRALQPLLEHQFPGEQLFIDEIKGRVGTEMILAYKDQLLTHARFHSLHECLPMLPALRLHDLMLQKWAFKLMLLHESLGEPQVLKKILNFDQYREYEYLRFERIHLIDMFFNVELEIAVFTPREFKAFLERFPQAESVVRPYTMENTEIVRIAIDKLMAQPHATLQPDAFRELLKHVETSQAIGDLLAQTLVGMLVFHVAVLLLPTYIWLRRRLSL